MRWQIPSVVVAVFFVVSSTANSQQKGVSDGHQLDQNKQYAVKRKVKGTDQIVNRTYSAPIQRYRIGLLGHADADGFHINAIETVRDYGQMGKLVRPAEALQVDARMNGNLIGWKLEPGDIITSVD